MSKKRNKKPLTKKKIIKKKIKKALKKDNMYIIILALATIAVLATSILPYIL